MQIIVPKQYVGITPVDIVIFLAGPVLGGGDWQRHTIEHFMTDSVLDWPESHREDILPRLKFVVPCRWGKKHSLARYFAKHYSVVEQEGVIEARQTYWEISYLSEILKKGNGFIFFGLFPESKEEPRTDGIPYGTDTRGELGRWTTIAGYQQSEDLIYIGAHPEFALGATMPNLYYFLGQEWLGTNCQEVRTPEDLADMIALAIFQKVKAC